MALMHILRCMNGSLLHIDRLAPLREGEAYNTIIIADLNELSNTPGDAKLLNPDSIKKDNLISLSLT